MNRSGRALRKILGYRRSLTFEFLEERRLLAVMRIVDWNAANHPNDAPQTTDFQTILQAIGNETVQGTTKRLDILALQETDSVESGNNSAGVIEGILDTLYPSTNYATVLSTVDGGGDRTAYIYDTSSLMLLNSASLTASLTHDILRAEFRPEGTLGESDFYIYSIHLKSGAGGSEMNDRAMEAAVLRADADALGEGANVLFVGDFNMKTSAEGAYSTFLASGFGQLRDVANAPGNWFDNAAFKSLHSNDPGAAMDDRFDIQFASNEFYDGSGVEYVAGSYHVFGNDGSHTFDSMITTGSGASPTVLAALANASDHLPVVADYQTLVTTPRVRIVESGSGTAVAEGGSTDTYQIALGTIPMSDVTVEIMPDAQVDVGNGPGQPLALLFTPGNALVLQTVTVTAVDDAVVEGSHIGLITHATQTLDMNYSGIAVNGVTVNITDNDAPATPTLVISEIMYDPASDESTPGVAEWIEVANTGSAATDLSGWKFDDEDATNWGPIPSGTILNPNQVAVFYDAAFTTESVFWAEWSIPASALVVGVTWGSLLNNPAGVGDEVITLLDNSGTPVAMDVVNYDNSTPWPSTGGSGSSIYLKNLMLDNNAGANWARSLVGTKGARSPSGPVYMAGDVGTPGWVFLNGDYNRNGVVDAGDYNVWRDTLGSTTSLFADGSGPVAGVPNGVVDSFDYDFWKANFGLSLSLTGGGGAGDGGGSGALTSLSAETAEPSETAALDAAFIELPLSATDVTSKFGTAVTRTNASVQSQPLGDLRLVLGQTATPAQNDHGSAESSSQSSAIDFGDVDQFFASLDERAWR